MGENGVVMSSLAGRGPQVTRLVFGVEVVGSRGLWGGGVWDTVGCWRVVFIMREGGGSISPGGCGNLMGPVRLCPGFRVARGDFVVV